jgi:hypothetical protein
MTPECNGSRRRPTVRPFVGQIVSQSGTECPRHSQLRFMGLVRRGTSEGGLATRKRWVITGSHRPKGLAIFASGRETAHRNGRSRHTIRRPRSKKRARLGRGLPWKRFAFRQNCFSVSVADLDEIAAAHVAVVVAAFVLGSEVAGPVFVRVSDVPALDADFQPVAELFAFVVGDLARGADVVALVAVLHSAVPADASARAPLHGSSAAVDRDGSR